MFEPRPYGAAVIVNRRWWAVFLVGFRSLYIGSCSAWSLARRILWKLYRAPLRSRDMKIRTMREMSRSIIETGISVEEVGVVVLRVRRRVWPRAMMADMESMRAKKTINR